MTIDWLPFPLPQAFKVVEPRDFGLLTAGSLNLSRGAALELQVSVCAEGRCALGGADVPGTEWKTSTINLLTEDGQPGSLEGFRRTQQSTVTEDYRTETRIDGRAESLSITLDRGAASASVEWLTNMPQLVWTRFTEGTSATGNKSFSGDHAELHLQLPTLSRLRIGKSPLSSVTEGVPVEQPGFVEYHAGPEGLPDEPLRHTVRRAFEFLFGAGLGVLGYCELNQSRQPLRLRTNSPYTAGGFGGSRPPALLHGSWRNGLDEKLASRLVQRYVEVENIYSLNRAIWLFLHARNAPLEMASGYIGAAFEILRRGYYERPENVQRARLFPPAQWTAIAQKLEDALVASKNLQDSEDLIAHVAVLQRRLGGLNTVSGSRLNEQLIADLGLKFGAAERAALTARNDDAHANEFDPADIFKKLQAYRAAHTLFARILLAILGGEVRYLDYSSQGYPDRELSEAQGPLRG